jgi:hypothetical protein
VSYTALTVDNDFQNHTVAPGVAPGSSTRPPCYPRLMAPPRWSADLARPIAVKGGPTLRTLREARDFMLDQPEHIQQRRSWQRAAELLLEAAENGADVEAVTKQVELALFLEARWAF